jgi:hypothetical protein
MSFAIDGLTAGAVMLALSACGSSPAAEMPPAPPTACVAGDAAAALELQIVYRTGAGFRLATAEAAPIPLAQAPQGGQILFVGVRVRNVDGCAATLGAALLDVETKSVVSLERRPIFLEMGEDGWLAPYQPSQASNYSNLPACPRANIDRSIDGERYELRVDLTDGAGRTAETSMIIIPSCNEGDSYDQCHCQCAKGYVLGMTC